MSHAIIRGANGRRHEVEFGDLPVRVEVVAGEDTVEIVIEAERDPDSPERKRFALMNVPRHLFSEALGEAAQRKSSPKTSIRS